VLMLCEYPVADHGCRPKPTARGTEPLLTPLIRSVEDDPAELRAKILRYRELLRQTDDHVLREAIEELLRLAKKKLNGSDPAVSGDGEA